ncbi:MAG TPA: ABC transporter ATP-binding protein [Vicinamibacteria bacterium]|jgi:ABC-2 type transport system ATP-binding protein
MTDPAVELRGLRKAYLVGHLRRRPHAVLHDLDLTVERGEVFGYLGPNGSGKTTTMKILAGLLRADAGTVSVLGRPLGDPAWRHRVGFLPEHPYFYDYLTPREYLDYAGRLFGIPSAERKARSDQLLEQVGLARYGGVAMRRFSKGMLQRLGLAQAMINLPELVFLDEPMSGLDPIGRRMVRDVIAGLKERGATVFFSTHILSDAESLCDRVALLREGRLVKTGRLDEILSAGDHHLEVLVAGIGAPVAESLPGAVGARAIGERWRVELPRGVPLGPVAHAVEAAGGRVLAVQPVRQSLEDYFVSQVDPSREGRKWPLAD